MIAERFAGLRADLAFIAHWVAPGSRVLDLGCGNGAMLEYLQVEKRCTGYGVEIDDAKIPRCVQRGVSVIQQDLEGGLAMFADDAFDTVLCLSALQMMKNVEGVLRDIARVGREAIVSFPNFAHWPHRLTLLTGRMPLSESLPYAWYDTPNLRCATIRDFEELAAKVGLEVIECVALNDSGDLVSFLPNWRGSLAMFRLRKRLQAMQAERMSIVDARNAAPMPAPTGWRHYFNRKMLTCVMLGFTSGLPLFMLYNLLSAWLKTEQVDLKSIGLFALVGFPYTWKFVWSPLMDRFIFPLLGRRRGWMFVTQLALLVAIGSFGLYSPRDELSFIVALAGLVAFLSASQDIVIDAYRRELLDEHEQGSGTALFVNAYKLSTLVPGSLSLILSDFMSWQMVFGITGLFMLPGMLTTLLIAEPKIYGVPPRTLRESVVEPFREFVHRSGWSHALLILAFIFLYKLGDSMATALATPFYMELGYTLTEIGLVAKNAGLWASLAGGILGAVWLEKTGVNRGLWIFGVLQAVAILGFALLAYAGTAAIDSTAAANAVIVTAGTAAVTATAQPSTLLLGLVIGLEAFAVGLGTAAFTGYIATTTDQRYTATQFALFTSLAAVPRTFFNAVTGFIVAQTGWFSFFLICFALAIPGMLLLPKIAPWDGRPAGDSPQA